MKQATMPAHAHTYDKVNAFISKIQYSNVPGRLFLFFLSGNSALVTYVPESAIGFIFKGSPQVGLVVACIAVLGLFDTIINDMLPDKFHFSFGLSVRHIALMTCSAFFALCAYLTVLSPLPWIVVPYFVACSLTISMHTFLDLRRRFKWGV